jgi:hypothetical protein
MAMDGMLSTGTKYGDEFAFIPKFQDMLGSAC